jgi:hypothetical protein
MTPPDDELDEFLRRRRPLFGRPDDLEPPLELDRMVLRQAREAIEGERPHRVFRAPPWGMPVALAATLVLAFTIILRVGTPDSLKKPEVAVQNVSRQIAVPAAPPPPPARSGSEVSASPAAEAPVLAEQQAADSGAVVVDLGAGAARADAPASNAQRARPLDKVAGGSPPARNSQSSSDRELRLEQPALAASATPKPAYRRSAKAWLDEIERLRAAGETTRADAELEQYKREHRAYAGAPDQ